MRRQLKAEHELSARPSGRPWSGCSRAQVAYGTVGAAPMHTRPGPRPQVQGPSQCCMASIHLAHSTLRCRCARTLRFAWLAWVGWVRICSLLSFLGGCCTAVSICERAALGTAPGSREPSSSSRYLVHSERYAPRAASGRLAFAAGNADTGSARADECCCG